MEIETERLLLRAWRPEDFEDFARISSDPEVMRYIGNGQPAARSQAWRTMAVFVGHWSLRGYGLWAAEELVPASSSGASDFGTPRDGLGWRWDGCSTAPTGGDGLTTEGGRAALDYAFTTLGANHVISVIDPANTRSIRVAENLGERSSASTTSTATDALIYGITRP